MQTIDRKSKIGKFLQMIMTNKIYIVVHYMLCDDLYDGFMRLQSSGRNARLWDNPLPEARNPGED
jgi:hypothetical protein